MSSEVEKKKKKKIIAVSLLNLTLLLPDFTTNKILSATSQGDYQGKKVLEYFLWVGDNFPNGIFML